MARRVLSSWIPQVAFQKLVFQNDRVLMLFVNTSKEDHGRWFAGAIETTARATDQRSSEKEQVNAVFDDHAHDYFGSFRDISDAFRAADKYAKRWFKRRTKKKCACGPIAKPADWSTNDDINQDVVEGMRRRRRGPINKRRPSRSAKK